MLRIDRSVTPDHGEDPDAGDVGARPAPHDRQRRTPRASRRVGAGPAGVRRRRGGGRERRRGRALRRRRACGTRRWCRSGVPTRSGCSRSAPGSPASGPHWPASRRRRSTTTPRRTGSARRRRSPTPRRTGAGCRCWAGGRRWPCPAAPRSRSGPTGWPSTPHASLRTWQGDPDLAAAIDRFKTAVGPGLARMAELAGDVRTSCARYAAHQHRDRGGPGPRRPTARSPSTTSRSAARPGRSDAGDVGQPARVGGARGRGRERLGHRVAGRHQVVDREPHQAVALGRADAGVRPGDDRDAVLAHPAGAPSRGSP